MTEIKLTFSVPHSLRTKLTTLRYIVDHLLILLGVKGWRWEFSDGAVKEVIRGPYDRVPPEVFRVPSGYKSALQFIGFDEAQELQEDTLTELNRGCKTPTGFDFGEQ